MRSHTSYTPREDDEQRAVADFLDRIGVLWCHVPNELGQNRNYRRAAWLKSMGVKSGVPDILIFDPPPGVENYVGTAIELKRASKYTKATEKQKSWLEALRARGWAVAVCRGAGEAIDFLQDKLGYGRVRPTAMERWRARG